MLPRWMTWLIFGLMLYVLYNAYRYPVAEPVAALPRMVDSAAEVAPAVANPVAALDPEHWKRRINPDYAARMRKCELPQPTDIPLLWWQAVEQRAGAGSAAGCEDTLRVKLTVWADDGTEAYTAERDVTLGAQEIAAGLDAALPGIRAGGARMVVLAPGTYGRAKEAPALPAALARALHPKRITVLTVERVI